jgi:hypothetical protein
MLNDGPERKKSVVFDTSTSAVPVNVKVSATAEPLRKQTITSEKTADLNDNPVMEAPFWSSAAATCEKLSAHLFDCAACLQPKQSLCHRIK